MSSCLPASDLHKEEDKIFHACIPDGGAVGGLYFGLYKDHTYQICSTGGIGQDCYEGKYLLNQDTLILIDLDKEIHLKSNKLLISRYHEERYGNLGEVSQLDSLNHKIIGNTEIYFVIRIDSLENFR